MPQYLKIGHFSRTHGLSGGLVLTYSYGSLSEFPAQVFIKAGDGYKMMTVESVSSRPDLAFVRLNEVNTLDSAKLLRGSSVYIRKNERPSANEVMLPDELVGMEVIDTNSGFKGVVRRVSDESNRRFLLVNDGVREIIIPLESPFVNGIDRPAQKIFADLPDGFLDI